MPRLDGVSATMYIRQHCPSTPIIAMTSNIRPDEVNEYFEHGKSDAFPMLVPRAQLLLEAVSHRCNMGKDSLLIATRAQA